MCIILNSMDVLLLNLYKILKFYRVGSDEKFPIYGHLGSLELVVHPANN